MYPLVYLALFSVCTYVCDLHIMYVCLTSPSLFPLSVSFWSPPHCVIPSVLTPDSASSLFLRGAVRLHDKEMIADAFADFMNCSKYTENVRVCTASYVFCLLLSSPHILRSTD